MTDYRAAVFAVPVEQLVPFDRKRFMTYSRIASAGSYARDIGDLQVALKPAVVDAAGQAVVDVTISSPRISFRQTEGRAKPREVVVSEDL